MPKSIPGLAAGEVEQLKIAVSRNLVLETNKLGFGRGIDSSLGVWIWNSKVEVVQLLVLVVYASKHGRGVGRKQGTYGLQSFGLED